ncbi:hypothetical protein KJ918_04295 [Patescibacteria group bacterium]|nr:hypothetical protein [Patescibacteria group bacterium]
MTFVLFYNKLILKYIRREVDEVRTWIMLNMDYIGIPEFEKPPIASGQTSNCAR